MMEVDHEEGGTGSKKEEDESSVVKEFLPGFQTLEDYSKVKSSHLQNNLSLSLSLSLLT